MPTEFHDFFSQDESGLDFALTEHPGCQAKVIFMNNRQVWFHLLESFKLSFFPLHFQIIIAIFCSKFHLRIWNFAAGLIKYGRWKPYKSRLPDFMFFCMWGYAKADRHLPGLQSRELDQYPFIVPVLPNTTKWCVHSGCETRYWILVFPYWTVITAALCYRAPCGNDASTFSKATGLARWTSGLY